MKKLAFLMILIIFAFGLFGIYTVTAGTASSFSPSEIEPPNEILFTIPVGEDGIHYAGEDNPDVMRWGPTAMAIAPDGSFWIADTADNRLIHFNPKGELLEKIPTIDFIVGIGDLLVTSKDIWILDMASFPAKVVQMSLDGKLLNAYDLPEGLRLEDSLSGIALGTDGSILVEQGGGVVITRFISPTGKQEQTVLDGYDYSGKIYSAFPADLRKEDASSGLISIGDKQIQVMVENELAGLNIIRINSDGGFFANVVEMVLDSAFRIDQKVYRYDSSGNLVGMARVPRAAEYVYVEHGIVAGPDNEVYALITKPKIAEIQKLTFVDTLPPILSKPVEKAGTSEQENLTFLPETCVSRDSILSVASTFVNTSFTINSYHINDPYNECPGRIKPIYLSTPGPPAGVSYSYNLWDTVDQFNSFMNGGNNGKFAGDRSGVYRSCARGIDCSGLVSRAWQLGSHTGTCGLESISTDILYTTRLQPGDIMNYCAPTSGHTIIFVNFSGNGMDGYEATTYLNFDRAAKSYRSFNSIDFYTPRRYNQVCNKILLPIIRKGEMQLQSSPLLYNPYPPPPSTPYP